MTQNLLQLGEKTRRSQSGEEAPNKAQFTEATRVRVLTHNIRYSTEAPFKGEEMWPVRRPRLCAELVFNSILPGTFICLQEVLHEQLLDIHESLNHLEPNEWARIGVGRDDGREAGEYSPIFYRPSIWELVHWGTIWLSETPGVPSKGWDATSTRIVTIGEFCHQETGQNITIASTHLDDSGVVSRRESAKLLLDVLEWKSDSSNAEATILAGDFNSPPSDEAYEIMTSPRSIMADVHDLVPENRRHGNELTFTGFSDDSEPSRIDFIFAKKDDLGQQLKVHTYAVLSNRFDDGVYSSDHRACVADFQLLPRN